ncbi:MAG: L,D-transpeptidase [Legionellaceae bacterium]|nr:L,D-transpeptidase [Legionellaceae bacterium]
MPAYYGTDLCKYPQYKCVTVGSGENWKSLFPNEEQRDLVQRVNRKYNWIGRGTVLAVPVNLETATIVDLAPFSRYISEHEKQVIIDQDKLAWVAYDENGKLVKWGPISSGRNRCPDSPRSCLTLTGIYRVFSKENAKCKSDIFPVGRGGAPMPYCMFFHKGFAMHGSNDVPGHRASHGCVRMFTRDAEWLNLEFVETANERNNYVGTKIIVRPVTKG